MKSSIRTFALSAAAAFRRPMVEIDPTGNQRAFRFKKAHLLLALGLLVPLQSFAASEAPYCIAVNGGYGNGGTTFVARNFSLPAPANARPGRATPRPLTRSSITTGGTSCLSSDNKALTVSVTSQDPWYLGGGHPRSGLHPAIPAGWIRPVYRQRLRLLRWNRGTGKLHQRAVEPAVGA